MSRATEEIRRLVGPLDPMGGEPPAAAPSVLDLTRLPTPEPPRRPVPRRSILAVAASALVVAGGLVVWNAAGPSAPKGYAATPPPLTIAPPTDPRPAKDLLEEIAARAANSGVPAGSPGRTDYTKLKTWSLNSQIDRSGTVSAVEATESEMWRHPDGSGREVRRKSPPEFQSEADRQKWVADQSGGEDVQDFGPGELSRYWADRPPTDVESLRLWLQKGHPPEIGPVETVVAITDLLREKVLLPAERAAILRVLAELPGVRHDGITRDRAHRPGEIFSLDSTGQGLPIRHSLIIDPANGVILAYEEMLTTSAGKLNVRIPAVISYETYLLTEFQN